MKALGIDIGTTTISIVILDVENKSVEKSYTFSNGSFIERENDWEKIQDPEQIIRKTMESLEQMGVVPDILPDVTEEFESIGTYKGIPVGIAIGDNQASFLGSVKDVDHAILVNMGTGGQISVLSDTCFTAKEIEARPFTKGKYLLVGSSLCGGRAYAILANFFTLTARAMGIEEIDPYQVMNQLLQERSETEPLKVTTTFSGTRWDPLKKGAIEQLTEANFRPDALTYALLCGMAEELYGMYAVIEEGLHISRTRMIASGNGLRRNHWLQEIMSEKFHMELQLADNTEEAAAGAVWAAVIAAGKKNL